MPGLLESNEYEVFDYKHAEEQSTLEEALKKVTALRNIDKSHFHRVVPVDETLTRFRIASVSREEVYADMTSRANKLVARFFNRLAQNRSK